MCVDLLANGLRPEQVVDELPDLELADIETCSRFASQQLSYPPPAALRSGWMHSCRQPSRRGSRRRLGSRPTRCAISGSAMPRMPPFFQAVVPRAVVMTKDSDFIALLRRLGPPPKVLWLTCGNTSNARWRDILSQALPLAVARLEGGED